MGAVTQARSTLPGVLPRVAMQRIEYLHNHLDRSGVKHGQMSSEVAPSGDERHWMRERALQITASLAGCERGKIIAMVDAVLAGYSGGRAHQGNVEVVRGLFAKVLGDLPEWAISQACKDWVFKQKYAPTPAELRELALTFTERFCAERLMIERVLQAEIYRPIPEDERRRVEAGFRKLLADLDSSLTADKPVDAFAKAVAEGRDDDAREILRSREAVVASPHLVDLLNRGRDGVAP